MNRKEMKYYAKKLGISGFETIYHEKKSLHLIWKTCTKLRIGDYKALAFPPKDNLHKL